MDEQQMKDFLADFAQKWLDQQKDALLLQLVGFIMDSKAKLENEIGSGEVQKIFSEEEEPHKAEKEEQNEVIEI